MISGCRNFRTFAQNISKPTLDFHEKNRLYLSFTVKLKYYLLYSMKNGLNDGLHFSPDLFIHANTSSSFSMWSSSVTSLLPRQPHSAIPDCRTSSSHLSARVPSTAEMWRWHSIETDPTRRRTLSCPCPAS